ncbi:MAG: hypothetical protein WCQ50_01470 [Spirochaetota bacterium]
MARAPFLLFKRGRYAIARSTRTADLRKAVFQVATWLQDGIPAAGRRGMKAKGLLASPWLEAFWTDGSPYLVGKAARGKPLAASCTRNRVSFVKRYVNYETRRGETSV